MLKSQEFEDYYEILELSPNASSDTIERVFRYLAKRSHPDVTETGDRQRFTKIVEAYQVLRDPQSRAQYDSLYDKQRHVQQEIIEGAQSTGDDVAVRHRLLSLFYAQRRRNMKQPGIGVGSLEHLMAIPTELLDFHLWYFREKGWVGREESGLLSITAMGVEEIERRELEYSNKVIEQRIEHVEDRLTYQTT